jgi:hypothetical protein
MVLNAIYEEDFLGFSYGFRPGRGPHDALDALAASQKLLSLGLRVIQGSETKCLPAKYLQLALPN